MVNQIYPSVLQLNKANTSDTEAPFLNLHLSIFNGFVSSKIYDKRDDFDFERHQTLKTSIYFMKILTLNLILTLYQNRYYLILLKDFPKSSPIFQSFTEDI